VKYQRLGECMNQMESDLRRMSFQEKRGIVGQNLIEQE